MSAGKNIDKNIINDGAGRIERLIADARAHIARSVNIAEVITKYEIGHIIVDVVQEGEERATYGKQLLRGVSALLTAKYGAGWSADTLEKCRTFYQMYSKSATVLRKSSEIPTDSNNNADPMQISASCGNLIRLILLHCHGLTICNLCVLSRMQNAVFTKSNVRSRIGVCASYSDSIIQVFMSDWP